LGVIVRDVDSLEPLALSNYHVLVRSTGRAGDAIAQPTSDDDNDVIGHLARWDEALDCATATLSGARQQSFDILDYGGGVASIGTPVIGTAVSKSGCGSGTTFGVIDGVSGEEFTVVPDPDHLPPDGEISTSGDSGAIWLSPPERIALGLHYGGESDPNPVAERAWAKRIENVAAALHICVANP